MHARRSLGQNFLTGSHYPERIVGAVNPSAGETIIEIGPGHGALTGLLLERGARVIAIEFDRELIAPLTDRFSHQPAFRLIEADALKVDFCEIIQPASTARVVANLPYNVATPILQHLIGHRACIAEMTLMFQREVVERITARPGGKEYGYLSVLTQFYCEAERLFDVPPGAFRPVPKVVSSVVRLRVRATPAIAVRDEAFFLELTSAIFAQRRKTVLNNLKAARARLHIDETADLAATIARAGIDPQRRAETLSLAETGRLADALLISAVRCGGFELY